MGGVGGLLFTLRWLLDNNRTMKYISRWKHAVFLMCIDYILQLRIMIPHLHLQSSDLSVRYLNTFLACMLRCVLRIIPVIATKMAIK